MNQSSSKKTAIINNYIYLLIEREFLTTEQSVYKIGRTTQDHNKRMCQYPKSSVLLFQMLCHDCVSVEAELIRQFKIKYKHRSDIGNEYFEGNCELMIKDIFEKVYVSFIRVPFFKNSARKELSNELENDVAEFLEKKCITQTDMAETKKLKIKCSELFDAFQRFSEKEREKLDFYKQISALGFTKCKSNEYFKGLDLRCRHETPAFADDVEFVIDHDYVMATDDAQDKLVLNSDADDAIDDVGLDYKKIPVVKELDYIQKLRSAKHAGIGLTALESLILKKHTFKVHCVKPGLTSEQEHIMWLLYIDNKCCQNKIKFIVDEKNARQGYLDHKINTATQDKVNFILKMTEILGLPSSQASDAIVKRTDLLKFGEYLAENDCQEFKNIKQAFKLSIEGTPNFSRIQFIAGIVKQIVHAIGYSDLISMPRKQERVNGKLVDITDFKLTTTIKTSESRQNKLIDEYLASGVSFVVYDLCFSEGDKALMIEEESSPSDIEQEDTEIGDAMDVDTEDDSAQVLSEEVQAQLMYANDMLRILKIKHPDDEGSVVPKLYIDDFERYFADNRQKILLAFSETLDETMTDPVEIINAILSLCGTCRLQKSTLTKYKLTSINEDVAQKACVYDELQKFRYTRKE